MFWVERSESFRRDHTGDIKIKCANRQTTAAQQWNHRSRYGAAIATNPPRLLSFRGITHRASGAEAINSMAHWR